MIRVLIVDDLLMICKSLKEMFVSQADIEVVGFAHDGKEAIKQITHKKPDVVLIDVLMPIMGGIEATRKISRRFSEVKVIVLSSFDDDPTIKEAISAGAKGYLLKDMVAIDLAVAIRSVHKGASLFAPGVIGISAKTTFSSIQEKEKNQVSLEDTITWSGINKEVDHDGSDSTVKVKPKAEKILLKSKQKVPAKASQKTSKNPKKVKSPPAEKPLFLYGDWISIILGIGILSQTKGMGHDLGHAGLFLLMLALIARPIRFWWDAPLKYRRTIGVLAFAAASGHAIYATANVLDSNPGIILTMSPKHQAGIWLGVISLSIMTPAAITSFRYYQKKLGKKWRQIHLLTVPALFFAVLHTILIGPNYLADLPTEFIDYLRAFGVTIVGLLVLLMRRKFFWSVLGLNKMGKQGKQSQTKIM